MRHKILSISVYTFACSCCSSLMLCHVFFSVFSLPATTVNMPFPPCPAVVPSIFPPLITSWSSHPPTHLLLFPSSPGSLPDCQLFLLPIMFQALSHVLSVSNSEHLLNIVHWRAPVWSDEETVAFLKLKQTTFSTWFSTVWRLTGALLFTSCHCRLFSCNGLMAPDWRMRATNSLSWWIDSKYWHGNLPIEKLSLY